VHNFFRGAKAAATNLVAPAKSRTDAAGARAMATKSKDSNVAKTRVPSAFLHSAEIFSQNRAAQKFFGAALRRRARRASRAAAAGGVYTQN